jgi:serine/threonine protein kinase
MRSLLTGVRMLVSTLRACHAEGWFHRDLRPGNLLWVEHELLVYVADWRVHGRGVG